MRGVVLVAICVLASLVVASHAATVKHLKNSKAVLVANARCKGAGEPMPNPLDCGSFLQCEASGVAAVKKCPAGLQFNAELRVCDFPASANCSEEDSTSLDSSSSEEGDGDDSSEEADKKNLLKKLKAVVKKPNVIPTHA